MGYEPLGEDIDEQSQKAVRDMEIDRGGVRESWQSEWRKGDVMSEVDTMLGWRRKDLVR